MTRTLIRGGLWALPVGGLLTFVPWLSLVFVRDADPVKDPSGFARDATSSMAMVVADVYIIGTLCILFGVLALGAALADTRGGSWAGAGAIAGVVAMVIVVGIWMVISIGDAIVGDVVISGHKDAGEVFKWMSGGHWNGRIVPVLVTLAASGLVGAVGLGVGLWRSGRYPKWLAVGFAVGFLLESAASPITMIGALLLVVTGYLIARGERAPAPQRALA